MIILTIILIILWLGIGLFGSIATLRIMMEGELDRQDYIFCCILSLAGPLNIFIAFLFFIIETVAGDKEILITQVKPKLTLKQERMKKLKKLKRFSWFRL